MCKTAHRRNFDRHDARRRAHPATTARKSNAPGFVARGRSVQPWRLARRTPGRVGTSRCRLRWKAGLRRGASGIANDRTRGAVPGERDLPGCRACDRQSRRLDRVLWLGGSRATAASGCNHDVWHRVHVKDVGDRGRDAIGRTGCRVPGRTPRSLRSVVSHG